jgi:hypothetical protein
MKARLWILAFLVALIGTLWISGVASAGCKSDCADAYESAKDDCNLLHDGPEDADDLRMCIDNASSEYEDCIDECES